MKQLENDKIRLRALEPEDLDSLYRWENDTTLWEVGSTVSPFSRYILKEYIAESHRDIYDVKQLRLMVELRSTGVAVGMVDLYDFDPHHSRAGIGVLIDKNFQRNGWATEALSLLLSYAYSFLKLHQLYVHIPVRNEASYQLFSRVGFTKTGVLIDWISTSEGFSDVFVMQKIKD